MKKTRFTEEQMVTILREADEKPVPEVAKKHGVSAQTIYGWRKHFGSLEPVDVKRLRQLEQENGRLKRLVADRDLDRSDARALSPLPAGLAHARSGRRSAAPSGDGVAADRGAHHRVSLPWPAMSPVRASDACGAAR
jgi:putative transposase